VISITLIEIGSFKLNKLMAVKSKNYRARINPRFSIFGLKIPVKFGIPISARVGGFWQKINTKLKNKSDYVKLFLQMYTA
jgi:hypothetical protein